MKIEQIKRTVYIALDGKEFSTERACLKHETGVTINSIGGDE